jgi:hypothetical protein
MGFYCSGCYYSDGYRNIAYPLWSFPSGGIFKVLPEYYQSYEKEKKRFERKAERAREQKEKDTWREYAKKFNGFFGFTEPTRNKDEEYPYSVFGLKKSSSAEDVKKAYRKSVLKTHPDKGGTNEAFLRVREAWEYFLNHIVK